MFVLTLGLGFPSLADGSRRSPAATGLRQLSTPFIAASRMAPSRRPRSAGRHIFAAQLFPRNARHRRHLFSAVPQLTAASRQSGERWPGAVRRTPYARPLPRPHLMMHPPIRPEIRAEQLLILPRADGHGDERLYETMKLGIPIIRDVPPIVIVTPPRGERIPLDESVPRRLRR